MEPPRDWAGLYILDDEGNPVPEYDTIRWAMWMEKARSTGGLHVSLDYDEGDASRQIRVSTVFLGVDHSFGSGPPILFETMVFIDDKNSTLPRELDGTTRRYHTRDEAAAGHQQVCQIVIMAIKEAAKGLPNQ